MSLTRQALYERVWQTPMTRLAVELNMSDVGLAKLCKSLGIPRPSVGHWAKVAVGKATERPPLTGDPAIKIPRLPSAAIRADRSAHAAMHHAIRTAGREAEPVIGPPVIEMRETLEGCLPIVAKTAKFFDRILIGLAEREARRERARTLREPILDFDRYRMPSRISGRFNSFGDGRLTIAATLGRVDWILRFHNALLTALVDRGCKIAARKSTTGESHWVEIKRARGVLIMSFAEDFELTHAPNGRWDQQFADTGYRFKDTMRLKIRWEHGTERRWSGTPQQLEASLGDIVWDVDASISRADADLPALLAERAASRQRFNEAVAAEAALREVEEQARKQRKLEKEWVEQALAAGDAELRRAAALRVIDELEGRVPPGVPGEFVREWIRVVRSRLRLPADDPLERLIREAERGA